MITRLLPRLLAVSAFAVTLFAQATAPAKPEGATTPAREPGLYTTIQTSMGPVVLKMFEKESPITVRNFMGLARGTKPWKHPGTGALMKRPLYNGTIFHRVIPGFMIQGGDPLGNGTGGTENIKDEFHPSLKFDIPGRLAMANIGEPNTGSCQFFITVAPTTHLNGKHTIFGQVVEGMDVVNKIVNVPRNADDKPRTPVRIVSVMFKREGPAPAGAAPAKPTATKKSSAPVKKKSVTPPK
jgi:cyclophilin family peptidyl-prolyl cis-trans isomerase